jgi:hypothetical protein
MHYGNERSIKMADILLKFSEDQISGAKLPLPVAEDNLAEDLIRWLHTRGLSASHSESKASLVRRYDKKKW